MLDFLFAEKVVGILKIDFLINVDFTGFLKIVGSRKQDKNIKIDF